MVASPWVGLPTNSTRLGHHRFAVTGEKYAHALVDAAGVTPVLLSVEALAPDGLVEAARSPSHAFVLGVHWHPEWRVTHNPFYHGIFQAFGDACRRYSSKADRS